VIAEQQDGLSHRQPLTISSINQIRANYRSGSASGSNAEIGIGLTVEPLNTATSEAPANCFVKYNRFVSGSRAMSLTPLPILPVVVD